VFPELVPFNALLILKFGYARLYTAISMETSSTAEQAEQYVVPARKLLER